MAKRNALLYLTPDERAALTSMLHELSSVRKKYHAFLESATQREVETGAITGKLFTALSDELRSVDIDRQGEVIAVALLDIAKNELAHYRAIGQQTEAMFRYVEDLEPVRAKLGAFLTEVEKKYKNPTKEVLAHQQDPANAPFATVLDQLDRFTQSNLRKSVEDKLEFMSVMQRGAEQRHGSLLSAAAQAVVSEEFLAIRNEDREALIKEIEGMREPIVGYAETYSTSMQTYRQKVAKGINELEARVRPLIATVQNGRPGPA